MGNLFGKPKKKESRVTEQDKAVLQLKQQRDKMKQYQKKIGVQMEKDRAVAKQLLHDGKKEKAKMMLRKKRLQESLLEKTDAQLENIERLVHDVEYAQIESRVVAGLKAGNESLKKLHELMSIEDVEKIMEDTQEAVDYQNEIDEILGGGLTQEDEEDVLNELDQLIQASLPAVELDQKADSEEIDINMPDVPSDMIADRESRAKKEAVLAS